MLGSGLPRKPGNILIVMDGRISRERTTMLNRVINSLRTFTTVDTLGDTSTEDTLLQLLQTKPYDVVLLPAHHYFGWKRAEAFWGLTRTSGPTTAGYFCEPLDPAKMSAQSDRQRTMLFDFVNLSAGEIGTLIKALQKDTLRTGIKPLLDPEAKIYCENWYGSQGLGTRIDSVLGLPEFGADPKWAKRSGSMRICLNALWSMIYEEGPGKTDLANAPTSSPKAYFQVSCDREVAVLRLCFQMPSWTQRSAVETFWPNALPPTAPSQLLLKYADFVRVHTFTNTPAVEIVVGFLPSSPAETAHAQAHTLWVEPLAENLFTETPYEAPGPASPRLRPLPSGVPQNEARLRAVPPNPANSPNPDDAKVIELQNLVQQKEKVIQELKSGGVGSAAPLPPPDADALIEAFQEKYFDARFQIRQLELEIVAMETRGATEEEIHNVRLKMEALANREQAWIKKLAGTLQAYKAGGKK